VTTKEWARAKELFSAAVALEEVERESFLQSQPDPPETLNEVRSLLAAYKESPDFLDDATLELSVEPSLPPQSNGEQKLLLRLGALLHAGTVGGQSNPKSADSVNPARNNPACSGVVDGKCVPKHIGPYRIIRSIGEGGMGIAYLAERDDGTYRQQVAIKVLKDGSHAPSLEKRFQNERQVLAELDHPYIARLLDGGATSTGQLYYVMEYVDGESVIKHASSHCLGLHDRLVLFMAICEAVAAAHRQLVIHGDIKPANILVAADGSPKLLDFGLAQIIRPAANDVTMSMVLLTPGYASPEQVRGERLSTATDIYSLGVLLHELLTGESPYGEAVNSPLELCRAICDAAPSKLSTVSETAISGLTPRQLRGDLDHIVLKTLRKSADERYASVDELRQDIQRYQDGFPVKAALGSSLYYLRKFVIRRRWFVALGAGFLLLASIAIWRIWRAEQIAELRFNQVRQLAHAMVFDVHDAIQDLPGSTTARKVLIERALEYLKGLEATSDRNRDLELELARAYTKIGRVQAAAAGASLEDCAAGIQNLEHARSLLRDIVKHGNQDDEAQLALVEADLEAADVHARRGEMSEWRALRVESMALLNEMAVRHPEDIRLRLRALIAVADTLDGEHNPSAALKAFQDVLSAAQRLPSDPDNRLLQARTERAIANQLQALGSMREALDHQRAALRILQELMTSSPVNTRFRLETSWSYTETAWMEHEFHEERAALADFDHAMQLLRAIAAADPGNQLARLEIGKLEMTEAETLERAASPRRSAEALRDALHIFADALKLDPTNDDVRVHIAQSELTYGDLLVRMDHQNNWCAGADAYRKGVQMASVVKDKYPATSVFDLRKTLGVLHQRLAACGLAIRK
jgi:eukaryotic-like serine/threonine-protein kinase